MICQRTPSVGGSGEEAYMYRCLCGAVFESPLKSQETVNHGEGMKEQGFCALCPSCGLEEPYFERIEEGEDDG